MTRVVGGVFRGAVVAWGVEQPGSRTDHQHDAGDRHPCIEADGFELGRADFYAPARSGTTSPAGGASQKCAQSVISHRRLSKRSPRR